MQSVANGPRDALIFLCIAMLRLHEDTVSSLGFLALQGCWETGEGPVEGNQGGQEARKHGWWEKIEGILLI